MTLSVSSVKEVIALSSRALVIFCFYPKAPLIAKNANKRIIVFI